MKRKGLFIAIAVACMTFYSCEEEESLTENPNFVPTATGETTGPTGGNGGTGNGGGTGGSGGGTGGSGGGTGGGTGGSGGGVSLTLTDTVPSNRVAVLEDFTGVRCQFCPSGAQIAEQIEQSLGDNFITIATHGGGFATPGNVNVIIAPGDTVPMGFADFRTPFANDLISQADVTGYPSGTMNRIRATDLGVSPQGSGSAMSRSQWNTAALAVNALSSPVNVGASATMDGSNLLTVNVELYYSAEETDDNSINVALLQDGIESIQIGTRGLDTAYIQNHVLRHYLTGQWGDNSDLTGTKAKGYVVNKTFTYNVPSSFHANSISPAKNEGDMVVNDMKVVVFVSRGQTDILNAVEVDIQ